MPRSVLPVLGLFVCAACGTPRHQAEERRVLVEVGMTGREVVQHIGRPTKIFSVAPTAGTADQTVEVWAYTYKAPADLGDAVEFGVLAGALVVFCVASQGRDTTGLGSLRIRRSKCSFWVGFGTDGKVRGVTNLEEAR